MNESIENIFQSNKIESNEKKTNFKYIKNIFTKDWKEIKGNKDLIIPIFLVPIIFSTILPIIMGFGVIMEPEEVFPGATPYTAFGFMINMLMKPMFLMIPSVISNVIACDSFAGEKERKTAESILVLPITHKELYLGKLLAALIPAILFSVLAFFLMALEINLLVFQYKSPEAPLLILGDITFWLVAFLMGFFISIIDIQIGIIISIRSKDVKSAQSVAGVVVVPILLFVFGSIFNPNLLSNVINILLFSLILGIISYILTIIGSKRINRERLIAELS